MEKNVLVGVTGSVATIKLPELVHKLVGCQKPKVLIEYMSSNILISSAACANAADPATRVVSTKSALHFFNLEDLEVKCYTDADEWLRKWADVMVIAPLDANTMAKMASGICDNLLTCVVRAWNPGCPLICCPAMNTFMWDHPHTTSHLETLRQIGYKMVPPVAKLLACGDQGIGAMASVDDIVRTTMEQFV